MARKPPNNGPYMFYFLKDLLVGLYSFFALTFTENNKSEKSSKYLIIILWSGNLNLTNCFCRHSKLSTISSVDHLICRPFTLLTTLSVDQLYLSTFYLSTNPSYDRNIHLHILSVGLFFA